MFLGFLIFLFFSKNIGLLYMFLSPISSLFTYGYTFAIMQRNFPYYAKKNRMENIRSCREISILTFLFFGPIIMLIVVFVLKFVVRDCAWRELMFWWEKSPNCDMREWGPIKKYYNDDDFDKSENWKK